jgi:exosortase K
MWKLSFAGRADRRAKSGAPSPAPLFASRNSVFVALAAVALAYALKDFYSRAGVSELMWILAPSAWLARYVGGIDLVYEQGAGYISYTHHMVVGSACAGVNFLIISFLCTYFSFARHLASKTRWLLYSLVIAFAATVAANGLRIFLAAHLWNANIYGEWMTREDMHRLAGTMIYYASLLALYFAVGAAVGARAPRTSPLFWYVGISLGVPLVGRFVAGGVPGFAGHAFWVVGTASLLTLVVVLAPILGNRIHLRT